MGGAKERWKLVKGDEEVLKADGEALKSSRKS